MPNATCDTCQVPLKPGLVSVTYLGAERPLSIRINQVPAMVCPRCRAARLEPALAGHLNDLGLTVRDVLGEIRTRPGVGRRQAA